MGPISEEDMVSTIMVYEYRISLNLMFELLNQLTTYMLLFLIELFDGLLL